MSKTLGLRHPLAPVVALALALAACGGGGDSAASIEEWCSYAAEAEAVDATFEAFGSGGDVEAGVKEIRGIVERLGNLAPEEIKADAEALEEGTTRLLDALEAADYNLLDADLSFMAEDGLEARMEEASTGLDEFTQRECGRPFGSGSDSSDSADDSSDDSGDDAFDPADGTLRDQLMEQFTSLGLTDDESACIAENLDFNNPSVQSGDVTAMFEVFDQCGISLDRLAEIGG